MDGGRNGKEKLGGPKKRNRNVIAILDLIVLEIRTGLKLCKYLLFPICWHLVPRLKRHQNISKSRNR